MAKPNKNEITRAQVYDIIAAAFGDNLVGVVDKKLRVNMKAPDNSTIQFAIAATITKSPVARGEAEEHVPTELNVINFEDEKATEVKIEKKDESKTAKVIQEPTESEQEALTALLQELNITN